MKIIMQNISQNRESWKFLRNSTLGSSEIVTVAGLNPYQTPLELWAVKTGKLPAEEENDAMWLGTQIEPIIGKLFSRRTGRRVLKPDCLYGHESVSWATATPDFFVLPQTAADGQVPVRDLQILECKNTSERAHQHWQDGSVPDAAHLQVQWQMGVLGLAASFVAGLVGGNTKQFYTPSVEFAPTLFAQCLELGAAFMEKVKQDIPPGAGPGDKKVLHEIFQSRAGSTQLPADEWLDVCQTLESLKQKKSAQEKEVELLQSSIDNYENQLKLALGQYEVACCGPYEIKASRVNMPPRHQKGYSYTRLYIKPVVDHG